MLKGRVSAVHLLQNREHVLMLLGSHGVGEHLGDRRLVDPGPRRQPQRDGIEVTTGSLTNAATIVAITRARSPSDT